MCQLNLWLVKEYENQKNEDKPAGTGESSQLILQLNKEEKAEKTCSHIPILLMEGQDAILTDEVSFTFKSDYGEEDILPFVAQLNSRISLGA